MCTDLEAAVKAEELRERMIVDRKDFTFETVLSTDRNLLLLQRAKEKGYFIRGIYVLTCNADINIARVNAREALGGHGVPEVYYRWSNQYWSNDDIKKISRIAEFAN